MDKTQQIGFNPETFEVVLTTGEKVEIRPLKWGERKKLWRVNGQLVKWFKDLVGEVKEGQVPNINPFEFLAGLYKLDPDVVEQIVKTYYQGDINRLQDIDLVNILVAHITRLFQG